MKINFFTGTCMGDATQPYIKKKKFVIVPVPVSGNVYSAFLEGVSNVSDDDILLIFKNFPQIYFDFYTYF